MADESGEEGGCAFGGDGSVWGSALEGLSLPGCFDAECETWGDGLEEGGDGYALDGFGC